MPQQTIAQLFVASAAEALSEGMHKIEHCVAQLTDEQAWWRSQLATGGAADMNSIANLMLHLAGNIRQWIVSGVGGAKDIRNRPLEFSDRSGRAKSEVLSRLKAIVQEALAVIAKLTDEQLVAERRIQGFDTNVLAALFNTISHFRGHTQEIIHMTRQQLGERYCFDFVPQGAEQESAGGH